MFSDKAISSYINAMEQVLEENNSRVFLQRYTDITRSNKAGHNTAQILDLVVKKKKIPLQDLKLNQIYRHKSFLDPDRNGKATRTYGLALWNGNNWVKSPLIK